MRRIAFGVLVIVLAGGLSACGDGDDDSEEDARPERTELGAAEFDTFCDAVVEYATATLPPGSSSENQVAVDALQLLVQMVGAEIDTSGRSEESGRVVRACEDDLTNVLQAATETPSP